MAETTQGETNKTLINTARVWTARARRSMTVKDAAAKIGIPPAKFSKWQRPSGYTTYLSEGELTMLSIVLAFPMKFFSEGDEDEEWYSLDNMVLSCGTPATLPSGRKRT